MKTCPKCEHKVEHDDNVCSNCGTRLREKCPKCGQMEPVKFINAKICQAEAGRRKEEFIAKNYSYKPFIIMGISGVFMASSIFLTASIYVFGLLILLVGIIYNMIQNNKLELSFIKNNPEIGVLLIE